MSRPPLHVRDLVFLAILSAVLLLSSGVVMPLVMFTHIYALRQMAAAPFFGFFMAIALMKVPRPGTLVVVGALTGLVLVLLSPVMLVNQVIGALLAEGITLALFKSYARPRAQWLAATLFVPLTLPITLIANAVMNDQALAFQVGSVPLTLIITLATILLSALFAALGLRLGRELRRAGKL